MCSQKRSRRTVRRVSFTAVALGVVLLSAACGGGDNAESGHGAETRAFSNQGTPVELPLHAQEQLARPGRYRGATFLQLARRDDRVFYRVEGTSEGRCFAIADDDSLGQITCDLAPRSADVVDMSILDVTESARAQLVVLAGVAPDRVARIDVVGPGNVVINSVDVIANVYFWRPAEPVSVVAANVVSRDGAVIRSLWRR